MPNDPAKMNCKLNIKPHYNRVKISQDRHQHDSHEGTVEELILALYVGVLYVISYHINQWQMGLYIGTSGLSN